MDEIIVLFVKANSLCVVVTGLYQIMCFELVILLLCI